MKKGFTLVEVMIVVAIIALFLAIIIPSVIHARNKTIAKALGLSIVNDSIFYSTDTLQVFEIKRGEIENTMGKINIPLSDWLNLTGSQKLDFLSPIGSEKTRWPIRSPEPKQVAVTVKASSPVKIILNDKTLAIEQSNFPTKPEVIIFNGEKYIRENLIETDPAKPRSIRDEEKYQYIQESFRSDK